VGDAGLQAEAVYRELAAVLAAEGGSFGDLTYETIFVRDAGGSVTRTLDVRERVLVELGQGSKAPAPSIIGQAPVERDAFIEVSVSAVMPRRRATPVREIHARPACTCKACARSAGRLVTLGGQTSLQTTNVYGVGADAFEEALDMFEQGARLLDACGMAFRDVIRTWVYVRDIDRDYGALNEARREFFRRREVDPRPASTGVQGIPVSTAHAFSLRLHALTATQPLNVEPISCPTLNEAWSYGADFSRGLRVVEQDRVTLHLSGTASIDEGGRSVHVGDLESQARRMLDNIESLLSQQGAGFRDILSGVLYVKRAEDAPTLLAQARARGFDGFPCPLVEAPLCRPELLCEAEALAVLPLSAGSA